MEGITVSGRKAHPVAAKNVMGRRFRRAGLQVPQQFQTAPPVVTWRAQPCRQWILLVYLTPKGWALDGRDFTIPLPQWIERVNAGGDSVTDDGVEFTLDRYRAGEWGSFNPREISGLQKLLPLDIDAWEAATFEVGCDHGTTRRPLTDLADDCRDFRRTRRRVVRHVPLDAR